MASSAGQANPCRHRRDQNAGGALEFSSAATARCRRPRERTATSACLNRASSTSASNALGTTTDYQPSTDAPALTSGAGASWLPISTRVFLPHSLRGEPDKTADAQSVQHLIGTYPTSTGLTSM